MIKLKIINSKLPLNRTNIEQHRIFGHSLKIYFGYETFLHDC